VKGRIWRITFAGDPKTTGLAAAPAPKSREAATSPPAAPPPSKGSLGIINLLKKPSTRPSSIVFEFFVPGLRPAPGRLPPRVPTAFPIEINSFNRYFRRKRTHRHSKASTHELRLF